MHNQNRKFYIAFTFFTLFCFPILCGCNKAMILDSIGLVEPKYVCPANDHGCCAQAWQDRRNCEQASKDRYEQGMERARSFADENYRLEMERYVQKEASCEEEYQKALINHQIEYDKYRRCLQSFKDPFEQVQRCGSGHRRPDRYEFCSGNFKPNYDNIIYNQKNSCEKTLKNEQYRCKKTFQQTWTQICGGVIE